jgi:hypothetical protein
MADDVKIEMLRMLRDRPRLRWGVFAAIALAFAIFLAIGGREFFWPSLDSKLRRDLELLVSGRDASATKVIGRADWICFNQANDQLFYRQEFLTESKRLGDAFTESLQECGIENSCCDSRSSHFSGAIGVVERGRIRCVEIYGFDFYLKANRPFCVKPGRLAVSTKVVIPGERPLGRQWAATPGRTSFEVGEKSDE